MVILSVCDMCVSTVYVWWAVKVHSKKRTTETTEVCTDRYSLTYLVVEVKLGALTVIALTVSLNTAKKENKSKYKEGNREDVELRS